MATTERYTTIIELNSEQAKRNLDELRKNVEQLRSKLDDAKRQALGKSEIASIRKDLKEAEKELKKYDNEVARTVRTLNNLQKSSIQDVTKAQRALKRMMSEVPRDSPMFDRLRSQLKSVNQEMAKIRDMQGTVSGGQRNLFSRMWDGLNRNWGAMTQLVGGYDLLRDTVKGCTDAFAAMDQEMANVKKYTGQADEEIARMNEDFKQMDTRTTREELNQLAGSAGRLGITSTAAVEEFVDAADKINVALGDDLGDGAVDKIGKLAMAFGEDDKMGLRGAMLATGSAVNDLAQNSAANAGYLVEFTARLAGVGMQAGLTQAQIMGIGAAMDENMQKDEMASTALSQIITKMTTDSDTFARIAGKNVEEFSKLVKTDMNAALMQFFEAMNKKGGFTELAPLFEQMGLDGTRAIAVLSTLANKTDDVRRHQQTATEAYAKGTSVLDEFNVQNQTYQAQLDKAKKHFQDLRIELGERLLPVATAAISTTSLFIKVLNAVIGFVGKYGAALATLTLTVTALEIAVYNEIIAEKIHAATSKLAAFWTNVLMVNMKKMFAVLAANPWAAAAAGIAIVVAFVADLTRKSREAAIAQKAMQDVQAEGMAKAETTRRDIEQLTKKIHDNTLSINERRQAVLDLQAIVPDYVATISKEGIVINENTEALDKYIQKMKEQAIVEGARAKMTELAEQRANLAYEKAKIDQEIQDRRDAEKNKPANNSMYSGSQGNVFYNAGVSAKIKSLARDSKKLEDQITETQKAMELMEKVAHDTITESEKSSTKTETDSKSNFDTLSYWQQELKARQDKLKSLRADAKATAADVEKAAQAVKEAEDKMEVFTGAKASAKAGRKEDNARREAQRRANDAAKAQTERELAELTHRYAMGEVLYSDYIQKQEEIQKEGLRKRMLIYSTESLEYQKLNHKLQEMNANGSDERRRLALAELRQEHAIEQSLIEEQAWRENMTEQQKNEMLFREDMRFLEEQRNLYRDGTLERINLEREISQRESDHALQNERYYQELLLQIKEQYLNQSDERIQQLELAKLEELKTKKLLSETEYQEALLAIRAKYANYDTTDEKTTRTAGNMLKVAQNEAKKQLDNDNSGSNIPFMSDIKMYQTTMEQLKAMYGDDEQNHAAYLEAKRQATGRFCEDLAQKMQAAYQSVNQIMQAASSYFSAQQQYETAQVQAKYEKQIEAAGNNQTKVKKLQEKQKKEEAAIKNKYNKKAMAIEIAQATAQTAMNAISAFGAVLQKSQPWTVPLAYAAAAAATASGMLQIAAIKKQHAAEQAGYYEGGFTGGTRYRREAGIVHEGEFVANHNAVNNPNIVPFLNFLDQAQRNNTVGSLTMADVSRQFAPQQSPQIVAPVVNVQTDNADLRQAIEAQQAATVALLERLSEPIEAKMDMQGFDRDYTWYKNLLKNK